MGRPRTVKGLIRKIKEFYENHRWGRGALYTSNGGWCLLGAAAAVMTNKELIRNYGTNSLAYYGDKKDGWKGTDLLEEFRDAWNNEFGDEPDTFNDRHSKKEVLARLNELESYL